jgi:outer membrane protein assembly factor BamB
VLSLCVILFPAPAWAGDAAGQPLDNWHQWRGPLATGVAPTGDPPVNWDAQTNVKWKAPLTGRGSATPIVWGDQVFVLTAVDTGRQADPAALPKPDTRFEKKTKAPTSYYQFYVLGFDRQTGQERWRHLATEQVPHEGHHETHSYAAASPTTDGRRLYVSFGSRGVFCYDLAGKLLWQRDLGRVQTRLGWGEAIEPVVHGNTLFLARDQEVPGGSFLIALDAATGETRWKVERDEKTGWTTPLVVEQQGRSQLIVNGTNRVRSYDPETGKLLWQCGGQTVNAIPSPVATNGLVVCMSGYRGSAATAIPLDAEGDVTNTAKVAWHHDRGTPYVPSPLLVGERLYFTQANNALLTCLNVHSGKPILDRVRLSGVNSFYASPVAAAGRIYLVSREGTTLVLKEGDQLDILATNHLDDTIDASPAIAGKQMFLRGERFLYCLEAK